MNVAVKAGDSIKWHSDGSVNHGGFNICFDRFKTDAPTNEPTNPPTDAPTNEPTNPPTYVRDPSNCADWTCTQWCDYFSADDEAAGLYSTNGCDADGDSCMCE